ncbi:VanZ family protein [Thauera propionica]|uniref:VanZ family protein n=1 Tax=Thauera propionica TaxID=2019431 RepID=UPI0023F2BF10|nr:VanZ family protein [Thauera propionica]MDD3677076.1 VanZ family protein [Thauera propionica]
MHPRHPWRHADHPHPPHTGLSPGWLVAALTYFCAVSLAHLQISLWIARPRSGPGGAFAIKDFVPEVALAGAALLLAWLAFKAWKAPRPWPVLALWLLLSLAVGVIDRFLTFSAPEYAHYPQFALLAWLLARALDPTLARYIPGRILFWTTLLGALDELVQYLWITTSYSEYLDFNDILVNMLGGAAGVLIYYGFTRPHPPTSWSRPRLELLTALVLSTAILLGLQTERIVTMPTSKVPAGGFMRDQGDAATLRFYLQRTVPARYATYNKSPYRGQYWILDPASGIALTLLGGLLLGPLIRAGTQAGAARAAGPAEPEAPAPPQTIATRAGPTTSAAPIAAQAAD